MERATSLLTPKMNKKVEIPVTANRYNNIGAQYMLYIIIGGPPMAITGFINTANIIIIIILITTKIDYSNWVLN